MVATGTEDPGKGTICPELALETSSDHIHEQLKSRNTPHGGVSVGALLVKKRHVAGTRTRLEKAFGNFKFLAVDRLAGDTMVLHLPTHIAAAFDAPEAVPAAMSDVIDAVLGGGAAYYPGVRTRDAALGRPCPSPPQW